MLDERIIDSTSVGDPTCFLTLEALEAQLGSLPPTATDVGEVARVVVRSEGGRRLTPDRVRLTREAGVAGDAWGRKEHASTDGQITVMQESVATLIANGQPMSLFGDNLFLTLDCSASNLPPGTRLLVGTALVEVTPKYHKGCVKFSGRFGADALRFVSKPELRARNLRGMFVRAVEAGEAGPGDSVHVIARGALPDS